MGGPSPIPRVSDMLLDQAACQICGTLYTGARSNAAMQLYFCSIHCEMIFTAKIVGHHGLDNCITKWKELEQ